MRLRLRIQRNELPAVNLLWAIDADELDKRQTVAQFLQRVAERVPLEGSTWGLEDYVVSLAGFELLHYDEVARVCRDEDELLIRPLAYVEHKTRLLAGRTQITPDGRRLLDGVAFGRPLLKRPLARPEVVIPPGKRQRVEEEEEESSGGSNALVRFVEGEEYDEDEDEDSEDDEDYEAPEEEEESEDGPASDEETRLALEYLKSKGVDDNPTPQSAVQGDYSGRTRTRQRNFRDQPRTSGRHRPSVTFSDPIVANYPARPKGAASAPAQARTDETSAGVPDSISETSSSSDDDDDDDSSDDDSSSADGSYKSESDSSSSDSDSSDDIDEDLSAEAESSWEGLSDSSHPPPPQQSVGAADTSVQSPRSSNKPRQNGTTSKKISTTTTIPPLSKKRKAESRDAGLPHEGMQKTKERNRRRRDAKKLAFLKSSGQLPADASFEDLHAFVATSGQQYKVNPETSSSSLASAEVVVVTQPAQDPSHSMETQITVMEEIERRRQKLLAELADGGVDVTVSTTKKRKDAATSTTLSAAVNGDDDEDEDDATPPDVEPSTAPKRARLDVASTQRLMFGSLGLRTPKTPAEREQLRKKVETAAQRQPIVAPEVPASVEGALPTDDDDEAWRRKLCISAVECCDEGVVLSAPPFPFQQRWDPQYQKTKKNKRSSTLYSQARGKKRRADDAEAYDDAGYDYYAESYDKYNTDGNGDALDYDDPVDPADGEDGSWEDGALLDGKRGYENDLEDRIVSSQLADAASPNPDAFPMLPSDISTLPVLDQSDAQPGDFLTFTAMACDAATAWQPCMVTRTVRLLEKGAGDDGSWTVQTAPRDRPPRKYDDSGKRIYEKFETVDVNSDEEEDENGDAEQVMAWTEMMEPRLLLRRAVTAAAEQDA